MPTLLILDDEPTPFHALQSFEEFGELTIVAVKSGKPARNALAKSNPDTVIVDVGLPQESRLEVIDEIKAWDPRLPIIVVTGCSATEFAIEAMKRGAFEYLPKPIELAQLREVVKRAISLRQMQGSPTETEVVAPNNDNIIGQSPAMQEVYKSIGRFAPQDVTVLILGESGTGKELVARALYQHSKRASQPFLAMNCAAIPETLLESELFGHEKGAFTGADRQRVGKFEQANGGTLFLDEIGDMSPATQAKVLRVLQDQQFERIGGREFITTDVRLIAATNRKLDELVTAGQFRQDLLYRLNGVTIPLPPLREHKSDLPLLVDYFLQQVNTKLEKQVRTISPEAMQTLTDHSWPGNVRELQNAIRYAVIRAVSDVISLDCLPTGVIGKVAETTPGQLAELREFVRTLARAATPDLYRRVVQEVDRVIMEEILHQANGNQVHASELLGLSRTTLRAKLGTHKTTSKPLLEERVETKSNAQ
jgi:nitrogen regulation protein NR(I)